MSKIEYNTFQGVDEYEDDFKKELAYIIFTHSNITKMATAKFFGVSPRTVGRWIDSAEGWRYDTDEHTYGVSILLNGNEFFLDYANDKVYHLVEEDTKLSGIEVAGLIEELYPETGDDIKLQLVPIQFIILPQTIVVVRDNMPLQIDSGHQYFKTIKELIEQNFESDAGTAVIRSDILHKIYMLIDLKNGLEEYTNGLVKVTQGGVLYNEKELHSSLTERLLDALINEGDEDTLEALTNFLTKLKQNPSFAVVDRLYDFISERGIRIHADGDLICYKVVRDTYFDKHSNTFDNSPGNLVLMPRNEVDDNHSVECGAGLHVCNKNYLSSFYNPGNRIVEVKVDPRNWVSVCPDAEFSKSRVSEYLVLNDVTEELGY